MKQRLKSYRVVLKRTVTFEAHVLVQATDHNDARAQAGALDSTTIEWDQVDDEFDADDEIFSKRDDDQFGQSHTGQRVR